MHILAAFSSACNAIPAVALTAPSELIGPKTEVMPTAPSLVVAAFGALVGGSAILLFANL